jgi:hypothetical protein
MMRWLPSGEAFMPIRRQHLTTLEQMISLRRNWRVLGHLFTGASQKLGWADSNSRIFRPLPCFYQFRPQELLGASGGSRRGRKRWHRLGVPSQDGLWGLFVHAGWAARLFYEVWDGGWRPREVPAS